MKKNEEHILVVKREKLFTTSAWQGLRGDCFDNIIEIVSREKEFRSRSLMEVDVTFKQIIPYLVFVHNNRYFLTQRKENASEVRLRNKYSLGIGGHIRKEDMSGKSIFEWAKREFHEEVDYQGKLTIYPLGVLNDDSNDVGKVHFGIVLLLEGSSDRICVKSELKQGSLVSLDLCRHKQDQLEVWSRMVLDFLQNHQRMTSSFKSSHMYV